MSYKGQIYRYTPQATRVCSKCQREFPATAHYFHNDKKVKRGLKGICKECANKRYRHHPEGTKFCHRCQRILPATADYFYTASQTKDGLGNCKECQAGYTHNHICSDKSKARHAEHTKYRQAKLKKYLLTHYGNKKSACVACGEVDIDILTIDHINNNGSKERKEKHFGSGFYRWLYKEGLPLGYQTLCYNCQWKKQRLFIHCGDSEQANEQFKEWANSRYLSLRNPDNFLV